MAMAHSISIKGSQKENISEFGVLKDKYKATFRIHKNEDSALLNSVGDPVHFIVDVPRMTKDHVEQVISNLTPNFLMYVGDRSFTVEELDWPPAGDYGATSFSVSIEY
jgi:hypothetical protein